VMVVARACERLGWKLAEQRCVVQGFGNVGGIAAQELADRGATVIAVSDISGGVYDPDGLDIPTMSAFAAEHGSLDVVVNCAGVAGGGPVHMVELSEFERVIRVNLTGTFLVCKHALRPMVEQRSGSIVNVASIEGIEGTEGGSAYNASKEAIRALTRTAAREWATDGIVVNCIAPAAADHHGEAAKQSEGYRIFVENCPMGRQGDPETDIGPLAWFLCSDACRYLTGHTFMADGGAFMWA